MKYLTSVAVLSLHLSLIVTARPIPDKEASPPPSFLPSVPTAKHSRPWKEKLVSPFATPTPPLSLPAIQGRSPAKKRPKKGSKKKSKAKPQTTGPCTPEEARNIPSVLQPILCGTNLVGSQDRGRPIPPISPVLPQAPPPEPEPEPESEETEENEDE